MKPRMLLQTLAAAVALVAASAATATPKYPTFTISPGDGLLPIVANDITGEYNELITFTDATHFSLSLNFSAGQFVLQDTSGSSIKYTGADDDLGVRGGYGLLALFNGTGTYTTGPGGAATFTLSPGGNLTLTYDKANAGVGPQAGFDRVGSAYVLNNHGDVVTTYATGAGIVGNGKQDCTGSDNCGSFGQTTSFALTAAGSSFFTDPVPFYPLSLQTGQFDGVAITVGSTAALSGSLDAHFAPIPEPADIALVGVALLGLGLTIKRRRSL